MSVQTQITRVETKISESYNVCNDMGATMPDEQVLENLPNTIRSIPQEGGAPTVGAVQEMMILTGVFDMSTAEISNLSHDYTQIVNALKENKLVIAKITTFSTYGNTILYGYPSWSATGGLFDEKIITFALIGRANFDGSGTANLLNTLFMHENGNNIVEISVI